MLLHIPDGDHVFEQGEQYGRISGKFYSYCAEFVNCEHPLQNMISRNTNRKPHWR